MAPRRPKVEGSPEAPAFLRPLLEAPPILSTIFGFFGLFLCLTSSNIKFYKYISRRYEPMQCQRYLISNFRVQIYLGMHTILYHNLLEFVHITTYWGTGLKRQGPHGWLYQNSSTFNRSSNYKLYSWVWDRLKIGSTNPIMIYTHRGCWDVEKDLYPRGDSNPQSSV